MNYHNTLTTWLYLVFFFIFQTARMNMMIYIALPSIPLSDCIEYKNHRNHRNIHIFHRFTFLFFPFSIHFKIRPLSFKFPEQSNYYNNQSLIDRYVFFFFCCVYKIARRISFQMCGNLIIKNTPIKRYDSRHLEIFPSAKLFACV